MEDSVSLDLLCLSCSFFNGCIPLVYFEYEQNLAICLSSQVSMQFLN